MNKNARKTHPFSIRSTLKHRAPSAGFIIIMMLFMAFHFPGKSLESSSGHTAPIRVGIFIDKGGKAPGSDMGQYSIDVLDAVKAIDPQFDVALITPSQIRTHALDSLDTVVFPGGIGSQQMAALGDTGAEKVREFIRRGGGYVGICAGTYLARTHVHGSHERVLDLAPAILIDGGKYWERGAGIVKVTLTGTGNTHFPEIPAGALLDIHYINGPILIPHKIPGVEPYETLMTFASDCTKGSYPGSSMKGTPFMIKSHFGKGIVVLVSGHPEKTPGHRWIIHRMITLAAGGKAKAPQ